MAEAPTIGGQIEQIMTCLTVTGLRARQRYIGGKLWKPRSATGIGMETENLRFKVGACNCLVINDRDDWDCWALVVETGQQRVLIDAGCGFSAAPPRQLIAGFQAAGLS